MYEIVQRIDYKGFQIQERRITSAGGAVATKLGGSRQVIPPVPVDSTKWAIVKVLPQGQEEEKALAWSEADAREQVDGWV